jgi:hypothetical protein
MPEQALHALLVERKEMLLTFHMIGRYQGAFLMTGS